MVSQLRKLAILQNWSFADSSTNLHLVVPIKLDGAASPTGATAHPTDVKQTTTAITALAKIAQWKGEDKALKKYFM